MPGLSVTLDRGLWSVAPTTGRAQEALQRVQASELDRFLADVEKRALRIAEIAVRNRADALDIVQDAMIQLARHYAGRPSAEWRPLFYRILSNRIHDFRRRQKVRGRLFVWLPSRDDDDESPVESLPDPAGGPWQQLEGDEALAVLEGALAALPERQQQAFLLRSFEGLDVAATAVAMGCSEGSVKTHYFRAVHALRGRLEDAS